MSNNNMSKIILFRGKSGTGKSTLSNELGKRLKLPVLHKDDIYDSVAGFVPEHDLRNKICFEFLYRFLQTVLDSGATIILDFGLNNTDGVRSLKTWVEERGGELKTFLCTCSNETTWSERLAERSVNPLPNQLITSLSELKEYYKNLKTEYLEGELILDTVEEIKSLVDQAEAFILEQNNGLI
ncbi:AAA family ATPase [Paenibacillus radicis (ex Xue et al. 2023)]|uniref:ATP-binding protein n=1 Tax=Paenibacillus radicis (ex Xue et al. 2023) TaxID=2972489 RepID=A0ABT1YAB1_9BACL|nr:ATP-binding protein [Paenibacillus radicis (ex Xue et al. 2023)]MCR8630122.1 ATP-binding protein [Paenibacillus radicis (ex Xue et al. 2023)]